MCLAVPMKVTSVDGYQCTCEAKGIEREVSLFMLQHEELAPGDHVLVHVGYAIQKVSADGQYVLFNSQATDLVSGVVDTGGAFDAFLYDRTTGTSTLITDLPGAGLTTAGTDAYATDMTDDGRFIAIFFSYRYVGIFPFTTALHVPRAKVNQIDYKFVT